MKRFIGLGLSAVALGLLLGAAVGFAGPAGKEWPTEVKLSLDPRDEGDFFEGRVSSENPTCEKGRKVVVKFLDGNDRIGSDKTDARGAFEVKVSGAAASGTYKAIAKKAEFNGFLCKKGTDTLEETHGD